jgi:hypothetical protein
MTTASCIIATTVKPSVQTRREKPMRTLYLASLLTSLLLLTGCEQLSTFLQETDLADGAYAELTIYGAGVTYKYRCMVDPEKKSLVDCKPVSQEPTVK